MQQIHFEYFRGMEAEQYSFYRIPKVLFTNGHFRSLSCEAKVLYGLMLDRMGLSIKNQWLDEENRVYIIFTVEEIMELLGCARQKAVKSIAELGTEKGIGLIEKRRLGLGKPNVIYVKQIQFEEAGEAGKGEIEREILLNTKKYENQTSGSMKYRLQEVPKSNFSEYENQTSRSMENKIPEVRKSNGNNTDINNTDFNDTKNILSILSGGGGIDRMELYRQNIRENIGYQNFLEAGYDCEIVDELVELMVEVMLVPDEKKIRIAGLDKPAAEVKMRFMKLEHSHMEYVLMCLKQNHTKVGNIWAYLLTVLYNASLTIGNYYQAEANYDIGEAHFYDKCNCFKT